MIKLFSNPLAIDQSTQKATALNLLSIKRPHMRGFLFAWLSFFIAFFGWFSIAPLITTIRKDLKLTNDDVNNSNIISVSSTILFRITAGLLCDRLGPRRVMFTILVLGSIPVGLSGLAHDATSLMIVRFFVGILGSAFVPCQFWTMQMFDKNAVGTANAFAGGWGNMGAGITTMVMPLLFDGVATNLEDHVAWRVTMVIPAAIIFFIAILNLLITDDCPQGKWEQHEKPVEVHEVDEKKSAVYNGNQSDADNRQVSPKPGLGAYLRAIKNPNVLVLIAMYACCFGVELAVDNAIATFFHDHFNLNQTTAGLIGSIFGTMNFFSRPTGGLFSDLLYSKFEIRGRLALQFVILFLEGLFLIVFNYSVNSGLGTAIVILVLFSYFTQAGCGTTYGIIPFVDPPIVGTVSGLVGAGGNVGGLVFATVFKIYAGPRTPYAFLVIGATVMSVSFLTFLLRVNGRMLVELKR
ncbi:7479_t:CDS:1 [Acaulospora morrowiae]|uniref:Nitrate/nitrite transporter n=1 Tax=Acaulospora morrowiae TaxID=94023 RepID=A0A9N9AR03_9GLOM|nr:7479_t:CDS:1 [Acaulospora morrowiae]